MIQFDHFVLAAPDLETAKEEFADLTGCVAKDGGAHPGRGTHNALCCFGKEERTYLEIIAPDPRQPEDSTMAKAFQNMSGLTPLHWAVATGDLPSMAQHISKLDLQPSPIRDMSRLQPDGQQLDWQLMGIKGHTLGGILPFFINWMDCPHPATTTPFAGSAELVISIPTDTLHELLNDIQQVALIRGEPGVSLAINSPKGSVEFSASELLGFPF
ncbi:MAG: VOC family protein [Gammaproteobacteria bacterium]|nr:VOC family protein [Gammaproteobacteria bacterium]